MHLPATENKAHPTNNPIHGKYVEFISNYIFSCPETSQLLHKVWIDDMRMLHCAGCRHVSYDVM